MLRAVVWAVAAVVVANVLVRSVRQHAVVVRLNAFSIVDESEEVIDEVCPFLVAKAPTRLLIDDEAVVTVFLVVLKVFPMPLPLLKTGLLPWDELITALE